MKRSLLKLWYWLTAWIPRPLPVNADKWVELQKILQGYFGVPNTPEVWATVAGHVTSTEGGKMRRPYAYLANVAKRMAFVNPAAQKMRQEAVEALQRKLAAAMKLEAETNALDETLAKQNVSGGKDGENQPSQETL